MKSAITFLGLVAFFMHLALSMDLVEAKPAGNLHAVAQLEALER